jgi:hypothetical protein
MFRSLPVNVIKYDYWFYDASSFDVVSYDELFKNCRAEKLWIYLKISATSILDFITYAIQLYSTNIVKNLHIMSCTDGGRPRYFNMASIQLHSGSKLFVDGLEIPIYHEIAIKILSVAPIDKLVISDADVSAILNYLASVKKITIDFDCNTIDSVQKNSINNS